MPTTFLQINKLGKRLMITMLLSAYNCWSWVPEIDVLLAFRMSPLTIG
jgi:hypothetical protein